MNKKTFCIVDEFEGTVHPKNTIVSSYTHLYVIPNLYEFLSYVEHKRKKSPLTSIVGKEILRKILNIFNIRTTLIQVWNDMKVSKWWHD